MKKNHQKTTNVLIAGTMTALLLTVIVGLRGVSRVNIARASNDPQTVSASGDAELTALQAQNAQLRAAVDTLLQREDAYEAQLDAANQTITDLSAPQRALPFGREHEEHEHDD